MLLRAQVRSPSLPISLPLPYILSCPLPLRFLQTSPPPLTLHHSVAQMHAAADGPTWDRCVTSASSCKDKSPYSSQAAASGKPATRHVSSVQWTREACPYKRVQVHVSDLTAPCAGGSIRNRNRSNFRINPESFYFRKKKNVFYMSYAQTDVQYIPFVFIHQIQYFNVHTVVISC